MVVEVDGGGFGAVVEVDGGGFGAVVDEEEIEVDELEVELVVEELEDDEELEVGTMEEVLELDDVGTEVEVGPPAGGAGAWS